MAAELVDFALSVPVPEIVVAAVFVMAASFEVRLFVPVTSISRFLQVEFRIAFVIPVVVIVALSSVSLLAVGS